MNHLKIHNINDQEGKIKDNYVKCPLCFEFIPTDNCQLDKHLNTHKERFLVRKNKTDIRSHETDCFIKNNFQCTYSNCQLSFKYISDLKEHIKKHFNLKMFQCSKCKKKFSNQSITQNHIYSHIVNRPYSCFDQSCNSSFICLSQLKFHIKSKHCYEEKDCNILLEDYQNMNKAEIDKKIELLNKEISLFKSKYPIISLADNESLSSKDDFLLQKKRKIENKAETLDTNDYLSLSNEQKMIIFLLNFVKERMNSSLYEEIISTLDKIDR